MPNGNLKIKHVYGYRCFDGVRNSAKYLADERIVFIQAGLGVILDQKLNT